VCNIPFDRIRVPLKYTARVGIFLVEIVVESNASKGDPPRRAANVVDLRNLPSIFYLTV
jgi:hypothetical protein